MRHPSTDTLLSPILSPSAAEHVAACAVCRSERELFVDAFGSALEASEQTWAPSDAAPAAAPARYTSLTPLGAGRLAAWDSRHSRSVELLQGADPSGLPAGIPGLQPVLEAGEPVVLAALEGAPLEGEPLPRGALVQLAAVLASLHRQGRSYGDLRLDDVRLRPDGTIQLRMPHPEPPGAVSGAAALGRAPEHRSGGRSPAGDAYSLGVLIGSLAAQCPDAPPQLDALCAALAAEDPAQRPDDAELLARLALLPEPGATRYPVLGPLGAGGMGEVVRVADPLLRREVALKRLHPRLRDQRGQRDRFIAEAQTIAQLQHPGIVPIFERGLTRDGAPYYTMPVVRGRTLAAVIAGFREAVTPRRWPEAEGRTLHRLLSVLRQAAEAVGYAHSRGVIHRDLKPDNIMVGGFGEVWVMDWGLSRVSGQHAPEQAVTTVRSEERLATRLGTVAGTPAYMAPEQAAGRAVDARIDVYALGTILYEILSGELPYGATEPQGLLSAIRQAPPPPLRERIGPEHPPLPEGLVEICADAMAREPADRLPDGSALAAALGGWLEGARRRRRARGELDKGEALLAQARQQRTEAAQLWAQADAACTQAAPTWPLLSAARAATAAAENLTLRARQQLQVALVFDPTLPEAHRLLARLHRGEARRSRERGEARRAAEAALLAAAHQDRLAPQRTEARRLLPSRPDSALLGRQQALDVLSGWWASPGRLRSLIGTAGVGKTRLALHFAHDRVPDEAAVFCELAQARTPSELIRLVADALGVTLQSDGRAQLGHALRAAGPLLLVLDNLEQLDAEARGVLSEWLGAAPALRVLATSRAQLGLPEEEKQEVSLLSRLSAAELFEQVGQRARPAFKLTEHTLPVVLEVVDALDRLPLALELAAARMGTLGLAGIRDWLSDRFALLRGRLRDPGARALSDALEASWSLLSEPEQHALVACSVFRGGWNLEAAEAVLAPPVLDLLDALVEDHLVVRADSDSDDGPRYTLLESIRAFAAAQPHPDLPGVRARHAAFYARFGSSAWDERLTFAGDSSQNRAMLRERGNLIAGMGASDDEVAACCALALGNISEQAGPFLEAGRQLLDFATRRTLPPLLAARLLYRAGALLYSGGEVTEARDRLQEAVGLAEASGAAATQASALGILGVLSQNSSAPRSLAREHLDRGLAIARDIGREDIEGRLLNMLGSWSLSHGDMAHAEGCYQQALDIHTRSGHRMLQALVLENYGMLLHDTRDDRQARQRYSEALSIYRDFDNRRQIGATLNKLGILCYRAGEVDEAQAHYQEALAIARAIGSRQREALILGNLSNLAGRAGRFHDSLALNRQTLAIARELGDGELEARVLVTMGITHKATGAPAEAEAHFLLALPTAIALDIPPLEAYARLNLGRLYADRGDNDSAREHYERAVLLNRRIGNRTAESHALGYLGQLHAATGDVDAAARHYTDALALAEAAESPQMQALWLGNLSQLRIDHGEHEAAVEILERALALSVACGDERLAGQICAGQGLCLGVLGRPDEARAAFAEGERLLRGREAPLQLALLLCQRAQMEHSAGAPDAAARDLDEARALAEALDLGPDSELHAALTETIARLA